MRMKAEHEENKAEQMLNESDEDLEIMVGIDQQLNSAPATIIISDSDICHEQEQVDSTENICTTNQTIVKSKNPACAIEDYVIDTTKVLRAVNVPKENVVKETDTILF